MRLTGITEQEFMDKLYKAAKDEIKTSNDGAVITHVVKIGVRNSKQDSSILNNVIERIVALKADDFIREKSEALNLGESDKKLSIDFLGIDGVYTEEFANEFICNNNLEFDDIISDNPIIREIKASILLYKKGLKDGTELMELSIIVALDLE